MADNELDMEDLIDFTGAIAPDELLVESDLDEDRTDDKDEVTW